MAGRSGGNVRAVNKAFKEFMKEIEDASLKWICEYARSIVYKAIEYRLSDEAAHNFTGNLLNSIVAAVYYNGDFKDAFFSGETGIRQPRYYEMTSSHGRYFFKVDYSGKTSVFTPEIETLRRRGIDDAYEFVSTYQPKTKGYVVVVAYTTEYASFVEMERHTTGYLKTFKYAEKIGLNYFQLPKKAA